MAKRDLFSELMEGFDALKTERESKITLRTTEIDMPTPIQMSANQIEPHPTKARAAGIRSTADLKAFTGSLA